MADKRREEDYAFKLLVEGPDDLFVIAHLRELNQLEDNICNHSIFRLDISC